MDAGGERPITAFWLRPETWLREMGDDLFFSSKSMGLHWLRFFVYAGRP
jgi:hypothetical protein